MRKYLYTCAIFYKGPFWVKKGSCVNDLSIVGLYKLEGKLHWVSFLCMSRPKASWNAIISAFLHALNFAPSLGACALPLTGVSALCFKGVLFPPQQRLLFKANNYNASYVKPHKIIIENSIFFPYLFRKKVDLRFTSNMKLHYQNTFVIKKMYRFSNTPTICGGLKNVCYLKMRFINMGQISFASMEGLLTLTALYNLIIFAH